MVIGSEVTVRKRVMLKLMLAIVMNANIATISTAATDANANAAVPDLVL